MNAIRHAIERYNKFAAQLDPPRPELTWEKIAEYSFAGEFDLLCETDEQIHAKHWASPANRQAAIRYFDVQRSKEELTRCNVEIVWLLMKMRDDEEDYASSISKLQSTDPPPSLQNYIAAGPISTMSMQGTIAVFNKSSNLLVIQGISFQVLELAAQSSLSLVLPIVQSIRRYRMMGMMSLRRWLICRAHWRLSWDVLMRSQMTHNHNNTIAL